MIAEVRFVLPLRLLVRQEAWNVLPDYGSRCFGNGYGTFHGLQLKREALDQYETILGDRTAHFRSYLKRLREQSPEQRAKIVEMARAKLERRHESLSPSSEQTLQRLARADPELAHDISSANTHRVSRELSRLRRDSDWAVAAMVSGLLAQFHGEFNTAFDEAAKRADPAPLPLADLKRHNDLFVKSLRTGQRGLYDAIAAKRRQSEVAIAAQAITALSNRMLRPHAALLAQGNFTARTLLNGDQARAANDWGRELLRGGSVARECIASFAASYAVVSAYGYRHAHEAVGSAAPVGGVPFDSEAVAESGATPLSELTPKQDGSVVTIEGFVSAIQVLRAKDGKLLSRVELLDPVSGARAYAAAVYTHFFHIGLTKGSFCRATGIYRVRSKLFSDKPVVEVERMHLADERQNSWRLGFLTDAQKWFRLYPNGDDLAWAIGPHRRPRRTGEVTFDGAGELLYPPLVRKP